MIYQAQYEITDQDLPVSTLKPEATERFTEDVLQLGMVINGPIQEPAVVDLDGIPWLQIRAEVRDAGQLLETVGVRA